mmetsp:Transcript_34708/g.97864  ORF Transcript_34708/g.97864 Transcript_34708/m.97864 type:complete len:1489 (+) Transcript_34708:260-4726(+)
MDRLPGFSESSGSKKQAQINKKLKKFYEKGASLSSRFKSLISYIEKAPEDDLRKFFNENFYMIYGVFLDTFSAYENQCKRGRHDASILKDLLVVLKNVLVFLADYVKKGWQIRSIATVLEKVLYIENKHAFRKQAFELLMQFLESVQQREEAQTDLLGAAISLQPLTAKYSQGINLMTLPLSAPDKQCILIPASGNGSIQESVELLEILLSFLDNSNAESFKFWWDLFKQQYLVVFYPSIWPSKTSAGKIGFPKCPEEVQGVLINRLYNIVRKKNLEEILWEADENKELMLEIFRQNVALHVNHDDTIRKAIGVYRYCYVESPPKQLSDERLLADRTAFIKGLASIMTSKCTWDSGEAAKKHESLCLDIIALFKTIIIDYSDKIDDKTQEVIFYTLLDTASEVLSASPSNPHLAECLHAVLIDTILFIWIYTRPTKAEHWSRLCSTMAKLFHTMQTVVQVRNKIIQLTMVLQDKIYYVKTVKKKKTAKRPGMMEQTVKHMEPKSPDSDDPPALPAKDEAIRSIEWTLDDALYVWMNMLRIFDTVNSIKNPSIHHKSMQTLWQVIQALIWSEDKVPYKETLDPSRPEPLCLINIFGPWLFEACDLGNTYVEGKAQAYKVLCKMFLRDHTRPLPLKLLAHFYVILQRGLTTPDSNNIIPNAILQYSSNVFNLALPGANLLIPYYLTEIRRVVTGDSRPVAVRERAVTILTSLICVGSHLNGIDVPIGGEKAPRAQSSKSGEGNIHDFLRIARASERDSGSNSVVTPVAPLPFDALLSEVLSIMTDALKLENGEPTIQVRLIWGVCVALFEIVSTQSAANLVTSGLVLLLLKHLTGQPRIVVRAAVHAVTVLASVAPQFRALDPGILSTIVESICSNILKELGEFKSNKAYNIDEALVADQFYCLLDWVLLFGDAVCNDPKLAGKVCEALEAGLTTSLEITHGLPQKSSSRSKRKSMRSNMETNLDELYTTMINSSTAILPQIREASENSILHLLHFLHNIPGREGIDVISANITHTDDWPEEYEPKTLHFVHNDSVLFSVVEIPRFGDEEGSFCRIICRDSTGKYAWDTSIVFDFDDVEAPKLNPFRFLDEAGNEVPPMAPSQRSKVPEEPEEVPLVRERAKEQLPMHTNGYSQKTDQLNELLLFLSENYHDCLPDSGEPLNVPAVIMEAQKARVEYTEDALVAQLEEDDSAIVQLLDTAPSPQSWALGPPPIQPPMSRYQFCKMILSHFGFVTLDNLGAISLLDNNEKVTRSLNQLDLTNGREMIKVGLIYVQEGQEEQIEVLRNDSDRRTPLFSEFVRCLGWPIDVETHRAYLGGLDPKLTTGVTAPYYATSTLELIFHDLTSMPTTDDPQQIHKKRHVGNDNVHIVWSEHLRDYFPKTIVSEFNDAHIVLYPLPNGLFKVHVFKKENIELFGPLMHGMCISKQLLPYLSRATCLMANKYVRYTHEGYVSPFANRKRLLSQIVERHKVDTSFDMLVSNVLLENESGKN